ncbi:MAG: hypothetical protein WCE44_06920 [Candidatus Velthaea sp.]|jgi:hypothetical protein
MVRYAACAAKRTRNWTPLWWLVSLLPLVGQRIAPYVPSALVWALAGIATAVFLNLFLNRFYASRFSGYAASPRRSLAVAAFGYRRDEGETHG